MWGKIMELKSFETRAIVLAIAGMLNDVDIKRIEIPITKNDEELTIYSVSSKDGGLDISMNPEEKGDYRAEFGKNLTKLYNLVYNAKAPLTDSAVDRMQKNWETMVPLIANGAKAEFLRNKTSKDLAKRGTGVMDGLEKMVMDATPLTSDSFIPLTAFCLAPQFYSGRPIEADELNRRLENNRYGLANIIKKDKQDFIRLMMDNHGANMDDAMALFNEVYGSEDEMLM